MSEETLNIHSSYRCKICKNDFVLLTEESKKSKAEKIKNQRVCKRVHGILR